MLASIAWCGRRPRSTTKTALAALTRWEIAKHEMEREAFLHYDLAKPRPEPEINVNFQGQEL
ncbi:hypothetical protein E4U50_000174 [Claviceps purpurea]|nr:hypothetical protein E4U50_000174 [Claviceps purpurea]